MTEEEWLQNPGEIYPHLNHVREFASIRRLRLAAAAFARWAQALAEYSNARQCADLIEELADSPKVWDNIEVRYYSLPGDYGTLAGALLARPARVGQELSKLVAFAEADHAPPRMLAILRDIFGNPFRPVTFDPRWRTSDVVGLAQAIYDDKAFERMPILADALMDAGCDEEQIIAHCRGDGSHVRGCWVVDLVLGKS
jgi:hypothetical protein